MFWSFEVLVKMKVYGPFIFVEATVIGMTHLSCWSLDEIPGEEGVLRPFICPSEWDINQFAFGYNIVSG